MIRGIVADGTTIAATIHSPSSHCFSLFHRLIVLVSGNVVYAGAIGACAGRVGGGHVMFAHQMQKQGKSAL